VSDLQIFMALLEMLTDQYSAQTSRYLRSGIEKIITVGRNNFSVRVKSSQALEAKKNMPWSPKIWTGAWTSERKSSHFTPRQTHIFSDSRLWSEQQESFTCLPFSLLCPEAVLNAQWKRWRIMLTLS